MLIVWLTHVPGIQVAGEAGRADEALNIAARLQPNIVLLEPKQLDAISLVRRLREVAPDCCIVIHTSYPDLLEEEALREAGASVYLVKMLDLSPLATWFRESMPPGAGGDYCG